MISDITDHESGATLDADVLVVGSGIAGAELATHLARHRVDVLLLESGREAFEPALQALNDLRFRGKEHRRMDPDAPYHPYLPPELRGVSRVRQFGGTSNVWTGKWKHLQRSDFPGRPWVPASAWPITLDDLLPHYRSAAADYGFGDLEAEARRPEIDALRGRIARHGLKVTSFYWEAEPTRTARRFRDEMRRCEHLRVVLGATVTELVLDAGRRRVTQVHARSLDGRSLVARANTVILATGAIETPRLLLASNRQSPGGIGNAHDLVGRFYTDHLKHHEGLLHPGPLVRDHARELQYAPKPRFCLCFALDDRTQAEHRLLEHVIYLKPLYERRGEGIRRRLSLRRAVRDGNGAVAAYRVKFVAEQVPHPESRVMLGSSRDALGVPEAVLAWRFTDADPVSLAKTVEIASRRLREAGLGTLEFGDHPPGIDTMTDAAHQIGTTRMSARAETGVVDADARVWGTENLFVAGSGVFPTCPSYSPTFTILALARRLGDHLLAERAAAVPRPVAAPTGRM